MVVIAKRRLHNNLLPNDQKPHPTSPLQRYTKISEPTNKGGG